jgi:hypothetical protein
MAEPVLANHDVRKISSLKDGRHKACYNIVKIPVGAYALSRCPRMI